MRCVSSFGVVACSAALLATGAAADETRSLELGGARQSPAGKLVFAGSLGDSSTLVVVNGDGTGRRSLLDSAMSDPSVVWSPDASSIAFAEQYGGPLMLASADGRNRRALAADGESPLWSPDGRHIAFARTLDVYVVGTRRGRPRRLGTAAPSGGSIPTWSPDGRRVAYGSDNGIVIVDLETDERELLLTSGGSPGHLAWSPDGATLAFVSSRNALHLIGADGGGERRIVGKVHDFSDTAPSWSPDGSRLVFQREDYETWSGIFTIDRDGRGLRKLLRTSDGVVSSPTWSPDGRHIAFSWTRYAEYDSYGRDVFVMSADGKEVDALTSAVPDDLDYGPPSWAPGRVPLSTTRVSTKPTELTGRKTIVADGLVETLAASDSHVAFVRSEAYDDGACVLTTLDAALRRLGYVAISGGSEECVEGLALAGSRAYWTTNYVEGNHVDEDALWTKTVESRPAQLWSVSRDRSAPLYGGNLGGDASVVVHNTWYQSGRRATGATLWRLDDERRIRLRTGKDAFPAMAAGSGRIAVLRSGRTLAILDVGGQDQGLVRVRAGRLLDVAVAGRRLVALRPSGLETYSLATGLFERFFPIAPAPQARLHDARAELAVYSRGIELMVLDLRSGRQLPVGLPDHAGPIDAALTSAGLYVAYNIPRVRSAGRIGLVPQRTIDARLP